MREQEQIMALEEEIQQKPPTLITQRLLVLALCLSFIASLGAVWLNWIVPINTEGWIPTGLLSLINQYRIIILVAPLICLLALLWVLRSTTGEIIAAPERYLDERQKMVRDQAHRSAYSFLKGACLLIPVALLLYNIFWHPPAPTPQSQTPPVQTLIVSRNIINLGDKQYISITGGTNDSPPSVYLGDPRQPSWTLQKIIQQQQPTPPQAVPQTHSPAAIAAIFGALLLSLFAMFNALPMSILAWKNKR